MRLQKPSQIGFGKPTGDGRGEVNTFTSTRTKGAPVALYGGTASLWFEPKSHSYQVRENGETRRVPSVTQILRIVDKSEPLTQWAANCAAELLSQRLRPGQALDELGISNLANEIRFNFRRVSDRAKNIGKLAHAWIEDLLRRRMTGEPGEPPLPVNAEARRACLAARDWLAAHHFQPLAAEQMIYSRAHGYAGTLDVAATASIDGRFSVIDWKTSAAIYPEYRLQLAAYVQALAEMEPLPLADRWIVRLGKDDGAFKAIHIGSHEQERDFRDFLTAKALHEGITEIRQGASARESARAGKCNVKEPISEVIT